MLCVGRLELYKKLTNLFNLVDLFLCISEAQKEDIARIKKGNRFCHWEK